MLNRVVLPQPEGPMIDTTSPRSTSKETWSTATMSPSGSANRLTRSSTTSTAGATPASGTALSRVRGSRFLGMTHHGAGRGGVVAGLDPHIDDDDLSGLDFGDG